MASNTPMDYSEQAPAALDLSKPRQSPEPFRHESPQPRNVIQVPVTPQQQENPRMPNSTPVHNQQDQEILRNPEPRATSSPIQHLPIVVPKIEISSPEPQEVRYPPIPANIDIQYTRNMYESRSPIHQQTPARPNVVTPPSQYPSVVPSIDMNYSNYRREHISSPPFYSTDIRNPQNVPSSHLIHNSPTYSSGYPAADQAAHFMFAAAFQPRVLMQNKKQSKSPEASIDIQHAMYTATTSGRDGKVTRPFKAYPKDPLTFAAGFGSIDAMLDQQSSDKYTVFRKKMIDQICAANGGQATVSNPKMRRSVNTNNNNYSSDDAKGKDETKDTSYSERRRKNNAAAKKSRDRRRIKEDEIAIRAAFLERENIELKVQISAAKKQMEAYGIVFTPVTEEL